LRSLLHHQDQGDRSRHGNCEAPGGSPRGSDRRGRRLGGRGRDPGHLTAREPMNPSLRIAVADDEPDMRDYFKKSLPRLGHQVVAVAQTGRELVELCRATTPDLVITDIRMPELDGIDAAAQLYRERPIPVILVSAF